jgi:hypothetical protein
VISCREKYIPLIVFDMKHWRFYFLAFDFLEQIVQGRPDFIGCLSKFCHPANVCDSLREELTKSGLRQRHRRAG